MRILIDTNVIIHREDNNILPETLQSLLRILSDLKAQILIHPESVKEINKDSDEFRKKVKLSKLNTYSVLEYPPDPNKDVTFLNILGKSTKTNDDVDNALLYSVYRDAVDFLITEDRGIHSKAIKLNVENRVLCLKDAVKRFEQDIKNENVSRPPALNETAASNLNINDAFFDSLRDEYGGPKFNEWFKLKCARTGRKCWVHFREDGTIGALLIYKDENGPIDDVTPPLPAKSRLKLSTLKVTSLGSKIGELFIKLAVQYSIKNNIAEIYLTHFTKPDDQLVDLITEYGFKAVAKKKSGEDVYVKELRVTKTDITDLNPLIVCKQFYPSFYDGTNVKKFIIPIRPEYHNRLFTDCKRRQYTLGEFVGKFIIEGNTIKKAYLCHSQITKISPGDIALFYRSQDTKGITSVGVVEKGYNGLQDKDRIIELVKKRTVYPIEEIEKISKKPTMVILFTWHFHLAKPLSLTELRAINISAPQSIIQISHGQYLEIKKEGI